MPQIRLNYRNPHYNNTHPVMVVNPSIFSITRHIDRIHGRIIQTLRAMKHMETPEQFYKLSSRLERFYARIEEYRDWILEDVGG